jgi:hypothetical protein
MPQLFDGRKAGETSSPETNPLDFPAPATADGPGSSYGQLGMPCSRPDMLDVLVLALLATFFAMIVMLAVFGAVSSAYLLKSFANIDLFPGPSPLHGLYEAAIALSH